MTEPVAYAWDTPGLPPRTQRERCVRHALCQYRDDDPAYCPYCHQSWEKVDGSDLNRREHVYAHTHDDDKRAASAIRRGEAKRK